MSELVPPIPPPRRLGAVARFDAAADAVFDRIRGNAADRVFYTASELGDFSLIWHLTSVASALRPGLSEDEAVHHAVRNAVLLGVESALVNGPIKSLFKRSRPVVVEPRPRRLRQPRTSSFPSGHASAAFTFLAMADPDDPLRPVYAALAVTVASSRAYVRIHHASDVVGGAIVGLALGRAFRALWPPPARSVAPSRQNLSDSARMTP